MTRPLRVFSLGSLTLLCIALFFLACNFQIPETNNLDINMTDFWFLAANNTALNGNICGTISGNSIQVIVPYGTDRSSLVADFTCSSGATVRIGWVPQESGVTVNDFSSPLIYTITSSNSINKNYSISVTYTPNTEAQIKSFGFLAVENPALNADIIGTISGNSIQVIVPNGTDRSSLKANFTCSGGAAVKISGTAQESDITVNDFTSPLIYTVIAENHTIHTYTITVSINTFDPNVPLTDFIFLAINNSTLFSDVSATINGTNIQVIVPYGTDRSHMIANFTCSIGAFVSIDGIPQESGVISNDFSSPLTYMVTSADGRTSTCEVTVLMTVNRSQLKTMITADKDVCYLDISGITDMSYLFYDAITFNQSIGSWDVSNVTDMSYMFDGATAFNQSIGSWDVSNVTDMSYMFNGSTAFNQNIGSWDVSNVIDMSWMFYNATAFNQNIGSWDVSNVSDMAGMFRGASVFNQNIGSWNVSSVTNMSQMFHYAADFNQNIGLWDVSKVTTMSNMFYHTNAFNQDIGLWDVSNVNNMNSMFSRAFAFNRYIGSWDVSNVTNMRSMFSETYYNKDIGSWDVNNVTDMSYMFDGATEFNQDIGSWDVGKVTTMVSMFEHSEAFNQNIGTWNVSNVTDMSRMFYCAFTFNQNIGAWNVSKVTIMDSMFYSARVFNQNIGAWNVSNVTQMYHMFNNSYVFNQDIGSWDVSKVTSMYYMFSSAWAFNQNLSSWSARVPETVTHTNFSNGGCPLTTVNHPYASWDS